MTVKRGAALAAMGLLIAIAAVGLWLAREKPPPAPRLAGIETALEDQECACLLPDGEVIYVGGVDGLYLLDAATLAYQEKLEIPGGPALQLVSALHITPDGALWVAHNRGISVRLHGVWRTFGKADGLLDLRANCFCPADGGLWAGTWGGAYFFAETNGVYAIETSFTMDNGLTDNMINAIHADADGTLWFGAYYHADTPCGLSILRGGKFTYRSVAEGLPHSFITSICALPDGTHYIGCGHLERGGLAVVSEPLGGFAVSQVYTEQDGLPGPKVRALYYDSAGRLWVATENDGLLIIANPNPEDTRLTGVYAKKENGLPDNEIKQIIEHEGYVYLAAKRGIARIAADF